MKITDEQWETLPKDRRSALFAIGGPSLFSCSREFLEALANHPQIELKILPKPEPQFTARGVIGGGWGVYRRGTTHSVAYFAPEIGGLDRAVEYAALLNAEEDA